MSRFDRQPLKHGKRWHFNVIYNNAKSKMSQTEDTKLSLKVTEEVVRRAKQWGFDKAYYTDRDALPGQNIFGELFTVIQGSEHTIAILTKEFLNNYWAKYCQMAAFKTLLDKDSSYKLIGILIGVDEKALPVNMLLNRYISFTQEDWQHDKKSWNLLKEMMKDPTLLPDMETTVPIRPDNDNQNIVQPVQEEGGVPSINRGGTALLNHGGPSLSQYGQQPISAAALPAGNTDYTTVFPDGPGGGNQTDNAAVGYVSAQSSTQQQSTTPVVHQYDEETEVKNVKPNTVDLASKRRRDGQIPVQATPSLPPATRDVALNSRLGSSQGLSAAPGIPMAQQTGTPSDINTGITGPTLQRMNATPSANSHIDTRTHTQTTIQNREQAVGNPTTSTHVSDRVCSTERSVTGNTGDTHLGSVATNASNSNQGVGHAQNLEHTSRGNGDTSLITEGSMDFSDLTTDRGSMPSAQHSQLCNQSVERHNNSGLQNSVKNLTSAPATEHRSHSDRTSASEDPVKSSLLRNQRGGSELQPETSESAETCRDNGRISGMMTSQSSDSGLSLDDVSRLNLQSLISEGEKTLESRSSERVDTQPKQTGNSSGHSDYSSMDSSGPPDDLAVESKISNGKDLVDNKESDVIISRTVTGDTKGGIDVVTKGGTDEVTKCGTDEMTKSGTDVVTKSGTDEVTKDFEKFQQFQSYGGKDDERTPDGSTTNQFSSDVYTDQKTPLTLDDPDEDKLAIKKRFGILKKNGIFGGFCTAVKNNFLK